ncbi:hypothetical protein LZ318_30835 [Saccharopolyspora indica]|uniref:hypothetical protein n=1 Tax=Saccharopolyspora indica TaxID=1229659 RepID=UPI0022EAEB01|nr:hypothetical protein [Saccharopolyspora indica]MDA3644371.1 hypothetical protein [Saccharopolyspora indica]
MHPDFPMSTALDRATRTLDDAQEQLHHAAMAEVARLVRDVFPDAEVIEINTRDREVEPVGFLLHAVRSGTTATLWNAKNRLPNELKYYRTGDGYDWAALLLRIEFLLTAAIGAERPGNFWESDDDGCGGEEGIFSAELPSTDEITALETGTSGLFATRVQDRDDHHPASPELWLARPARRPAMDLGRLTLTASSADGTVTLDIDTVDADPGVVVRVNGTRLSS